jgi:hypothetical protein
MKKNILYLRLFIISIFIIIFFIINNKKYFEKELNKFIIKATDINDIIIREKINSISQNLIDNITIKVRKKLMKSLENENLYNYSNITKLDLTYQCSCCKKESQDIKLLDNEFYFVQIRNNVDNGYTLITNYASVVKCGASKRGCYGRCPSFKINKYKFWIPNDYIHILLKIFNGGAELNYYGATNIDEMLKYMKIVLQTRIFSPMKDQINFDLKQHEKQKKDSNNYFIIVWLNKEYIIILSIFVYIGLKLWKYSIKISKKNKRNYNINYNKNNDIDYIIRIYLKIRKSPKIKNKKYYYNIFDANEDMSMTEITKLYKKMMIKVHPDKNPNDEIIANIVTKECNKAYEYIRTSYLN